ncbi:helix-turn-helix domain-containing protein [Streptomyces drozdowiczii]
MSGEGGSEVEGVGEPGSPEAARALGRQLRRLRENAQLTQDLMVKLHGGSKTSISRYENGDRIPRTDYVKALLEETEQRGRSLTDDALAAVWALYERALGPVGGRNSERAALYAQEKQLRLVQAQEAQAAGELARLAADREVLETQVGADAALRELDADRARIERHREHLARERRRIVAAIDAMPDPGEDGRSSTLVPLPGPPGTGSDQPTSLSVAPGVPPWQRLMTLMVVLLIAVAAIIWGVAALRHDDSSRDDEAGGTAQQEPGKRPSGSSTPTPTPTPTPKPTRSPSSSPPTTDPAPPDADKTSPRPPSSPAAPAAVAVRWSGNVTLDDGSSDGNPSISWAMDPVPPQRSAGGDISLLCQLVCESGRYAGRTIVVYQGNSTPQREECISLLNANPGSSIADVPDGTVACFGTQAGRVGYFTPHAAGRGQIRVHATVWELPPG